MSVSVPGIDFLELGGWPGVLARLFRREDIGASGATAALAEILEGRADPVQIAAFLAALRTKGESAEEMTGLAAAMRARSERVIAPGGAIDTCGTGGDRSGTVNVSTMAAFVAVGAGVVVCKHGGGAASSRSGSADVLRSLGVVVDLGPEGVEYCLKEAGVAFCFAPRFHPAMRHAGPVRSGIGVATIFNFLGPLCNPASVARQVVGVGDPTMASKMLDVLEANEAAHAMVVFGHDGLDELTVTTTSTVLESHVDSNGGRVRSEHILDPRTFGMELAEPAALVGGDSEFNAQRARALLGGEGGPQRDFLLLNAAAALVVAGKSASFEDGLELAARTIDGGSASAALDALVESSNAAPR